MGSKSRSKSKRRSRSKSRKRRRKKSTSSSSSSSKSKEKENERETPEEPAPQAQENGDEERIDRIKNAARVNRIKKRRQAARELVMVEPKDGQPPVSTTASEPAEGKKKGQPDLPQESVLCIDDD